MAVQDTYLDRHPVGYVGMIADTQHAVVISRTVEDNAMGFGIPAIQGAGDNGVIDSEAGVTAAQFVGITVRSQVIEENTIADTYDVGDTASIIIEGVVWVTASVAVAPGDPVYFVPATGVFTNVATGNVQVPRARFETTAGIGELAKVRLQ